jgi:hypothetical protein
MYSAQTKSTNSAGRRGWHEGETLEELAASFASTGDEAFSIFFENGVEFSADGVKWFNSKIQYPEYVNSDAAYEGQQWGEK